MLRVAQSGSLQRWQQVTPVLLSASPLSTPTGKAQLSSHHSHDTLHVLQKNDKKVSPVPPSIQGVQPMSAKPTKDVLSQAQSFLKNQEDRSKVLRDKIQNANQGAACREFHTSVSHGASCGTVVEEWDDEMACVLQGTCLPGSTMYCRTKSMFGKLKLSDVDQGTFGTVQGVRRYSTSSPAFSPVRRLSDSFGRTYEAWDEDLVTQVPVPNKPSFNNIPKIDKATRSYYQAEPRAQFVPVTRFGDAKRSYHTGDIVPLSQRMGRSFETWDEDVAHMIHNLHSKPVFGRPRRDIRPPSDPPKVYVPVSCECMVLQTRHCHTSSSSSPAPVPKSSQRERLKQVFRDYGATVVIFHVSISLLSLGGVYLAVSSGIDLQSWLYKVGVGQAFLDSRIATGASTFVVSYAIYKLFAPVRMAITITATPFIVRYLRKINILKQPVPK